MEETIEVNGVKYRREVSTTDVYIIRTENAGVHFGTIKSVDKENREVVLLNSTRVHYWKGAASLSQMAIEGVKNPAECRFAVTLPTITLSQYIEIIPITEEALKNLNEVDRWKV